MSAPHNTPLQLPSKKRRYTPLTPSPLNPDNSYLEVSQQSPSPPTSRPPTPTQQPKATSRPKLKLPSRSSSETSPTQWLLRHKAAAAWRSEKTSRRIPHPQHDILSQIEPPNTPSRQEPSNKNNGDVLHEEKDIPDGLDGEAGDLGLGASDTSSSVSSEETKEYSLPSNDRNRSSSDENGDTVGVAGVETARRSVAISQQLLMTTEAGTVVALPLRRRPTGSTLRGGLLLLGFLCGLGLIQCLLRSFTPLPPSDTLESPR